MRRRIALLSAAGLAVLIAVWARQEPPGPSRWTTSSLEEYEEPPRLAPDTEGEAIDGQPLRLRDYRGKVVVVSFWGHW